MSESNRIAIFDARSSIAAYGNKFKGGGYEDASHYQNATLQFCDIENIHAVRDYFERYTMVGYSNQFN